MLPVLIHHELACSHCSRGRQTLTADQQPTFKSFHAGMQTTPNGTLVGSANDPPLPGDDESPFGPGFLDR